MRIVIKRVYEPAVADDGFRVLVDRLWPRGLGKAAAKVDLWIKEIAPSAGLRKSFHKEGNCRVFQSAYEKELEQNAAAVDEFISLIAAKPRVSLLYASKNGDCNNAKVLAEYLKRKINV